MDVGPIYYPKKRELVQSHYNVLNWAFLFLYGDRQSLYLFYLLDKTSSVRVLSSVAIFLSKKEIGQTTLMHHYSLLLQSDFS